MVHCTIFQEVLRELGYSVHLLGAGGNHPGVIHREIKGANILTNKGGIARTTRDTFTLSSPTFRPVYCFSSN